MKTTSFLQDQRHETKSQRFQPIKPELIESVLKPHGFNLVSLKTGRAINPDRTDHQTTIARYRSQNEMRIGGHHLDIVAKVPHLYGAVELFLGTFRQVCSNGMTVGVKFTSFKVKHLINPMRQIQELIPLLVAQEQAMVETITAMQSRYLSDAEQYSLAARAAVLRMAGKENVLQVMAQDLLVARRAEDEQTNLYTVFNRVQENLIRNRMRYTLNAVRTINGIQESYIRNGTTRPVGESSVRSVEFNRQLWDLGTSFLKVA